MNELAPISPRGLVPTNMGDALRLAELMCKARTLPRHLQDSPGDCLMVIEQAMRWGMSPFAVAQATSVISGKLMFEGKLVASAVESSGAITGHIDYAFAGEGDARTITVSATRRGETNPRTVAVSLREARTANEMWKRQPDQQLVYHGTRVWARRWTPAVILGVYSREEIGPVIEGQIASDEAETPAAPAVPNPPAVTYPLPKPARPGGMVETARTMQAEPEAPKGPTLRQVVARLIVEFGQAQSVGGLADIEARDEMQKILAREEGSDARKAVVKARNAARARLGVDTDSDWDTAEGADPIAELIAEIQRWTPTRSTGWQAARHGERRRVDLFPLDADRLEDAISARKEALKR